MSNLKLVTTESFGTVTCDFYRNMNDDILLTREQIGEALEYADSSKAIRKIHLKHKDRLESLCVRTKLSGQAHIGANLTKSEEQERVYYTERGIMEICRWSRQPKANQFMDWCWDIVEKYRNNQGYMLNAEPLMNAINTVNSTILEMKNDINEMQQEIHSLKEQMNTVNQLPEKKKYPSFWSRSMFPKYRAIEEHFGYSRRELFHKLYLTLGRMYKVDLDDVQNTYCMENGLDHCFLMDAIESHKDLREKMEHIVDCILKKWNIAVDESEENQGVFDLS